MKLKKALSIILALAMILSLSIPAFASFTQTQTTVVSGSTSIPTIAVTVPASANVVVNPYKMEVTIPGTAATSTAQIISPVNYIVNNSDVDMRVDVSVTGTLGSDSMSFASSAWAETKEPEDKELFVYLEGKACSGTEPAWTDYSKDDNSQVVLKTKAVEVEEWLRLEDQDGTNFYGAFRLAGKVAAAPLEAWSASDTLDASIAFTFIPTTIAAS